MIEFGNALRSAREAKGYTIRQLAEATNLPPKQVEELEAENFSRIVAPIYGRGFVRLYCEAVGLEVQPMIDEFMEIYNGNRDTGIKERTKAATTISEETVPPPDEENDGIIQANDDPEMETSQQELGTFQLQSETMPLQAAESNEKTIEEVFEGITTESSPSPYRYATPIRQTTSTFSVKPSIWRIVALTAGVVIILGLIATGIRALYRATSNNNQATEETIEETMDTEVPPATTTQTDTTGKNIVEKTPRKPQSIPQLYLY